MAEVDKVKKSRTTCRRSVTKLVGRVEDMLKNGIDGVDAGGIGKLKLIQTELSDKSKELKESDKVILDDLTEKDADEDAIDKELDDTQEYKEKISGALYVLEDALQKLTANRQLPPSQGSESQEGLIAQAAHSSDTTLSSESSGGSRSINVKLPKLELSKFSGKVHEFQEFWDGFKSAIHENESLASVDKLKYLRSFLLEPAKSVIAGMPLTDASYNSAIELLKKRFGKPEEIQRAHINHFLHLPPVFNEKSVNRLRTLHDQIETHFRGLEALGVDKIKYSSIVVPELMEKIPESIRFNMIRGSEKSLSSWSLDELLAALEKELSIRESYVPLMKNGGGNQQTRHSRREEYHGGTATALYVVKDGSKGNCVYCLEDHAAESCEKVQGIEERKCILRKYAKCFICLNSGHRLFECRNKDKFKCRVCNGRHHTSICRYRPNAALGNKETLAKASAPSPLNANATSWVGSTGSGGNVALQTALANVEGMKKETVRVLFDTGSHKSFITAEVVAKVGLRPVRREDLGILPFGSTDAEVKTRDVVEVSLVPVNGKKKVTIECYVVDEISSIANAHPEVVKETYPHLHNIWFSDICRHKETLKVDILIGSDSLWNFQESEIRRGGPNEPVAVKTTLGWVLSGPLTGMTLNSIENINVNFLPSFPSKSGKIEETVQKLWDLETIGIRPENEVHEHVIDNIIFTGKRYSVGLPWKAGHKALPTNYENSLIRLKSLGKKLRKDPPTLAKYNDIINEQAESGVIEQVTELEPAEETFYLPHMAVVRAEAETTKVRIVYDASCKDRKTRTSLNDCLHIGPTLTPLIFNILLRFRENKVVLVGDIEKAFLNIEVHTADRDCLRFLWFKNCWSENSEIVVFRFLRVVFGVNSSPFLPNAVLRHHLEGYKEIDPNFTSKLLESFYVDDLVTGCKTLDEAFTLYQKASERLKQGGFRLRKWKTNSIKLAERIEESENETAETKQQGKSDESSYAKEILGQSSSTGGKCKILGMSWDNDKDTLEFDLAKVGKDAATERPTKRRVLSTIATIFDPQGIISPISIMAKVFFQDLCKEKLDWDDPIQVNRCTEWNAWLDDLARVNSITLPRWFYNESEGEIRRCEIHGFGDASSKAYCAVVYLVYETVNGVHMTLLCSKTRVAPLKALTIPRLELLSARILSVLVDTVRDALSSQLKIDCVRYWVDSKTALYWIFNNGEWKQWVQFRVREILRLSKKEEWGHVGGKDNPADLGSRGVTASQLENSELWWNGPQWLRKSKDNWPTGLTLEDSEEVKGEKKKANVMIVVTGNPTGVSRVIDINRYGTLRKLLRVTAVVMRFVENVKAEKDGRSVNVEGLSVIDIISAERLWIKEVQSTIVQNSSFRKTMCHLGIAEMEGILVCMGRLEHSDLSSESKYPIYLPKEHRFTELIVEDCHRRVHHYMVNATLAELRSRFWISKGRQFVKKILKRCFICRKLEAKPFQSPPTAAMPDYRVTQAAPFSNVGIDFAGPLYVKEKRGEYKKVYICLFVCCVTRALHLELVQDLSAVTFLNCLRRFCARRGWPSIINSDNAKTFKSSSKLLRRFFNDKGVNSFLESGRMQWKFNIELSPWQGGHYERMVRSVKRCLRKVLGSASISFDELSTVVCEVECILNSRPLSYISDEADGEILTPSHLLMGRRLLSLPAGIEGKFKHCETDCQQALSKRFLHLTRILSHFWNRWRREYLINLRETHKMNSHKSVNINPGDVVLVHEDSAKRAQWKIAVVEELIRGKDNEVRGARVRRSGKGKIELLNRPVQKLVPLECAVKNVQERKDEAEGREVVEDAKSREQVKEELPARRRSQRIAAKDARLKTQLVLDS